jgi:hypothetical protein
MHDFASLPGMERLARLLAVARNFFGNLQRDAREQTAGRQRDLFAADLDLRRAEAREHKQDRAGAQDQKYEQIRATEDVDADARRFHGSAEIPLSGEKSDQARLLVQADRAEPGSTSGDVSRQRDRLLAMSHESLSNQVKLEAQIARLSARIDALSARERQIQGNWRRLSMESQNRTQQNMGGN